LALFFGAFGNPYIQMMLIPNPAVKIATLRWDRAEALPSTTLGVTSRCSPI
jgi:hypothetical protein